MTPVPPAYNLGALVGLVSLAVPLLVAAALHSQAATWKKSVANIVLALVNAGGWYASHLNGAPLRWQSLTIYSLESVVLAQIAYRHLDNVNVIDLIKQAIPGGIGGPPPPPPPNPLAAYTPEELQAWLDQVSKKDQSQATPAVAPAVPPNTMPIPPGPVSVTSGG